jgi:hypothetical protein
VARAVRKAESLQKQRLRRGDWDTDYDDADEPLEAGFDAELEDSPEDGGDGLEEEQE